MNVWQSPAKFEWDQWNIEKNRKHGLETSEIEEVFFGRKKLLAIDYKHNQAESRYILIGYSQRAHWLYVVFTMRQENIRVISARYMHHKEVKRYEKTITNT
jgi:uncharacterized protein